MDKPILINSNGKQDGKTTNTFTIKLNEDIALNTQYRYYLTLYKINMAYTWLNVSSSKGKNPIRMSKDNGTTWETLSIDHDGNYNYNDIDTYIQNKPEVMGHPKDSISMYYVSSAQRVYIELKSNYQIDFRSNLLFGELIGFENLIATSSYGTKEPNLTRSVHNVIANCNLINNSIYDTDNYSKVLYTFPTNDLKIGYAFSKSDTLSIVTHKDT